jgi:tRNA dimethylallyltransferase
MAISVHKPPLALIAGPTASSKSALALAFAKRTRGVIVNADSAQVYRDLPVLSATPTAEELSQAEHRLYGYLDGAEACSAADWAERAKVEISEIQSSGRLPILTGGSGLYLRTLLNGIAPIPAISTEVRTQVREASVQDNRRRLEKLDSLGAARLGENDSTRVARALEVVLSTGKSLADWQQRREGGIADQVDLKALILLPPRDWLYARCNARFAAMIEQGAVHEVRSLLERGLNSSQPVMRAIGVREIAAYLSDETSLDEAVAAGQQATRRYAKRQYTWFAHQPPADWPRFTDPLEPSALPRALELLIAKA